MESLPTFGEMRDIADKMALDAALSYWKDMLNKIEALRKQHQYYRHDEFEHMIVLVNIKGEIDKLQPAVKAFKDGSLEDDIPFAKIGREGFRLLVLCHVFNIGVWKTNADACREVADVVNYIDPLETVNSGTLTRLILHPIRHRYKMEWKDDEKLKHVIVGHLKPKDYKELLEEEVKRNHLTHYLPLIERHYRAWEKAHLSSSGTLDK